MEAFSHLARQASQVNGIGESRELLKYVQLLIVIIVEFLRHGSCFFKRTL